jgi:hypothetical protein
MTGEPLEPLMPTVAAAQLAGELGAGHIQVIRSFFSYLPDDIGLETLTKAEEQLANLGGQHRPDELAKLAQRLVDYLHPDGNYSDEQRFSGRVQRITSTAPRSCTQWSTATMPSKTSSSPTAAWSATLRV